MILQKAVEYGFPAEEREGLEICSLKKYNFFSDSIDFKFGQHYAAFASAIVLRTVVHYSINQNFNYAKNNDVIIIQMLHGSSRFCRSEYTDDSPRGGTDPRGGGQWCCN